MKKTPLIKLAEIITFLNVSFTLAENYYILHCNEEQYQTLIKVLPFYCYEFTIKPTNPIDDHFVSIYIEILFDNVKTE